MTANLVAASDGDRNRRQVENSPRAEEASIEGQRQTTSIASNRSLIHVGMAAAASSCASRLFDAKASIVLVGLRGTGKSSLAIMLSTTCNLRVVETERYFIKITGHSMSAHRKEFGVTAHQKAQSEVLQTVLSACPLGCVIVCNPRLMDHGGQRMLQEYAKTHPIIHVVRDIKSLQSCLPGWSRAKVEQMKDVGGSILRACSTFEFYNLTEDVSAENVNITTESLEHQRLATGQMSPKTPFLMLKRVEREFLKFLGHITGGALTIPFRESTYPLSRIPVESKSFTYAVQVPLQDIVSGKRDIEDLETASDAFEILVDSGSIFTRGRAASSTTLDEFGRALTRVRRDTLIPVVYHVPYSEVSADFEDDLICDQYCGLVSHCLRLAPEFVTVDLLLHDEAICKLNTLKGRTKLIGHFTFVSRPSGGWNNPRSLSLFDRACELDLDACRINMPADTIDDNFALQSFRERACALHPGKFLIAYNTGHTGRMSVCFNPTLTPVRPECMAVATSPLAPSLTASDCTRSLYGSFLFEPMKFYIIGAAISYTLSPAMHNAAYRCCGMPHKFMVWQTASLSVIRQMLSDPQFGGTAVNPPFKTEVIALTHSLSSHAKAIGAVNTLIPVRRSMPTAEQPSELYLLEERNQAGAVQFLHGDNTDWIGIRTCIRRGLSPINAVGPRTTGLVIGAGGMARATIYSMMQLGVQNIFIYNRTVANAEKLAAHYNNSGSLILSSSASPTTGEQQGVPHRVRVIGSLEEAWPSDFQQPTIIVSCIPAHDIGGNRAANFTLPSAWLQSSTGGVVVEVSH